MMEAEIDEVIAAPIFSHAQFKGDDFTAREIARTIRAALRAHGMEVVNVNDLQKLYFAAGFDDHAADLEGMAGKPISILEAATMPPQDFKATKGG